ncbi:LysR family transcriptional regulator [Paracraurococcus lichenis]|uniref:LysR family transcriptional regulator n=1 Tax=Paracraurococcus lichenis TaxID=3064888 RepID=A0ABT9EAF1_9PROT|nr:LysR family transcriptional regulator [Paracraurococcus sp. LOR1-02]MDO9713184.1 LysR family transcriptional regulator [Paracraurococcus sp. LOR1-02]
MTSTPEWQDRIARRMRLRDLHIFSVVVRTGSMTKAAAELGITQPAVSHTISDLEAAVGNRPLLERTQSGVIATPYGKVLLERSSESFDALHHAVRDIEFLADPGSGKVSVGASESFISSGFLATAIDRMMQRHPRLSIEVVDVNTAELDLIRLRDRSLDVVLGRTAVMEAGADVEAEVLYDEPILAIASAQSRWAHASALTLHGLREAPWLLAPPGTAVRMLVDDAFRAAGVEPPRSSVTTYSMQLRMQLLTRGNSVSSLPASLLRLNGDHWGLQVLPVTLGKPLPVVAITLRRRTLGPAVRLFLDYLREAIIALDTDNHR